MTPDTSRLDDVLDCLKVSDVLAVVWPLNGEISEWDQLLLSAIKAHGIYIYNLFIFFPGIPTVINIVPGLTEIQSGKKRDEARKSVQSAVCKWYFFKIINVVKATILLVSFLNIV